MLVLSSLALGGVDGPVAPAALAAQKPEPQAKQPNEPSRKKGIKVGIEAPSTGTIHKPLHFTILITNSGAEAVKDIQIIAKIDPELGIQENNLKTQVSNLEKGESRRFAFQATPREAGPVRLHIAMTLPDGWTDREF